MLTKPLEGNLLKPRVLVAELASDWLFVLLVSKTIGSPQVALFTLPLPHPVHYSHSLRIIVAVYLGTRQ